MADLVKVEFKKLGKSFGFKMLILSNALLCVLFTCLMSSPEFTTTGHGAFLTSLTQVQSNIILWAILAGLFICSDFVNRTSGLFISAGKSRFSIFASKMLAYLVGSTIITLIMPIFMTISCSIISGFGEEVTASLIISMAKSTLVYLIVNAAIASLCALVAYIFRSVGASIGIGIGVLLVLLMVSQVPAGETVKAIFRCTVFGQANLLATIKTTGEIVFAVVVSLITMGVSLAATYLVFKKAELK